MIHEQIHSESRMEHVDTRHVPIIFYTVDSGQTLTSLVYLITTAVNETVTFTRVYSESYSVNSLFVSIHPFDWN